MRLAPGRGYTLEQGLICVGRGWHPLVARAFEMIESAGGHVIQVKEKWGGLQVSPSWDGVPDNETDRGAVYKALAEIEAESGRTCERCGARGWQVGKFWIKTLCMWQAPRYLAGERFPDWEQQDDENLA